MRCLILILSFFLITLSAEEFRVPRHTDWVVDEANLFSQEERLRILRAVQTLTQATGGGQMAVVTLKGLHGIPIEEAGIRIAEAWKVGRKGKDDGAILIIVPSERRMRLEIGYGWEGSINDAKAGDIIRELAKFFRINLYASGTVYAIHQVQYFITGKKAEDQPDEPPREASSADDTYSWIFVLLFFGIFFFAIINAYFGGGKNGRGGGGSSGGGGFFGGGGGSSRGGGGFSGGGGGSFGGGGASGRW